MRHTPGFFLPAYMAARAILFIDGNNWFHGLKSLGISDPLAFLPDPTDGIDARIDDLARRWRLAAAR